MDATGRGLVAITTLADAEQPSSLNTVTLYVPALVTYMVLYAKPLLHWYRAPEVAFNAVLVFWHIVMVLLFSPLMYTVGFAMVVMVVEAVLEQLLLSITVTMK